MCIGYGPIQTKLLRCLQAHFVHACSACCVHRLASASLNNMHESLVVVDLPWRTPPLLYTAFCAYGLRFGAVHNTTLGVAMDRRLCAPPWVWTCYVCTVLHVASNKAESLSGYNPPLDDTALGLHHITLYVWPANHHDSCGSCRHAFVHTPLGLHHLLCVPLCRLLLT